MKIFKVCYWEEVVSTIFFGFIVYNDENGHILNNCQYLKWFVKIIF